MTGRPATSTTAGTAPVAVVTAMREELTPLLGRARIAEELRLGSLQVRRGQIGDTEVLLTHSGEGAHQAEEAARALLERFPVSMLLVLGTAGGLQPGLRSGAIVAAGSLRRGSTPAPAPDPALVERAVRAGALRGTVVSASRMLCTSAAKAVAWAECDTDSPAVVDLESAAFARVASERDVPCLVVRAVCDAADEDLPFDFNLFTNERGGVRRAAVAREALLHPGSLPRLMDLRRRVQRSAERLARFAEDFLDGEKP